MDPITILTIGERLIRISLSAWLAFRQAAKDQGAGVDVLAQLDAQYDARIARERAILDGTT